MRPIVKLLLGPNFVSIILTLTARVLQPNFCRNLTNKLTYTAAIHYFMLISGADPRANMIFDRLEEMPQKMTRDMLAEAIEEHEGFVEKTM